MIHKLQQGEPITSKIYYDSALTDWIPSALEETQKTQDYFQELADNTTQGYLRKIQQEAEMERRNKTTNQRILDALNIAADTQNQYGITDQAVQDKLDRGDIKGATNIAKEGLKGAGLGYLASASIPIVTEAASDFATYGLLGGLGKQGGMWLGNYLLEEGGSKVGKGLDNIFNTGHVFKNGLGFTGGLLGFGWGKKAGYNLAKEALAKRIATRGTESVPTWYASNTMKRDLAKDLYNAGWRIPSRVRSYQRPLQITSRYEAPMAESLTMTPATGIAASWESFLSKTPREQNDIVRYWNGEKYGNFNTLRYFRKDLDAFKRWWTKK